MNTERRRERLKILYIFLFFFSYFLFSLIFIFILRIIVVDLSCNIELGSLYIKLHCCLNLNGDYKYLWKSFSPVLITVSMNLFNRLVIVIFDPVMEG